MMGHNTKLYRAVSNDEYNSIVSNLYKFSYFPNAMEMKWFATSIKHVKIWGDLLYKNGSYKIIVINVPKESLKHMYYVKFLDGIGPAYAADVESLNKFVKKVRLL